MLIFDRTQSDTARARYLLGKGYFNLTDLEKLEYDAGLKGCLNTKDLNRIEKNTAYLAGFLNSYGYFVKADTKVWTKEKFCTRQEIDRIRSNVAALQEGFYTLLDWREIVFDDTLDFIQANALEWDLKEIDMWLARMVESFVFSGEIYSGER